MIGADIEFFLRRVADGKLVPACGLVGGTKQEPVKIDNTYSVLEDGAAIEFNYAPQLDGTRWSNVIRNTPNACKAHLNGEYVLSSSPEAFFADIKKYPQAMIIGCDPDFDAYAKNPEKPRKIPNIKKFGGMRFAGAHIHLSYTSKDKIPAWVVARLMDVLVLCPVLSSFGTSDWVGHLLGESRRGYYGLPGLHRPKPYGIEYRTLSPAAFTYGYNIQEYVQRFHYCLNAEKHLQELEALYMNTNWDEVRSAVNNLDTNKMKAAYDTASRQLSGF